MSPGYPTLVFCDNCASLAVAELDRAPLCMTCLLEELRQGKTPGDIALLRIRPLKVHRKDQRRSAMPQPAEVAYPELPF